jgi:WD40 repeat protein
MYVYNAVSLESRACSLPGGAVWITAQVGGQHRVYLAVFDFVRSMIYAYNPANDEYELITSHDGRVLSISVDSGEQTLCWISSDNTVYSTNIGTTETEVLDDFNGVSAIPNRVVVGTLSLLLYNYAAQNAALYLLDSGSPTSRGTTMLPNVVGCDLAVYPNPVYSGNIVNIRMKNAEAIRFVSVFSLDGRLVARTRAGYPILAPVTPGLYFLSVSTVNEKYIKLLRVR